MSELKLVVDNPPATEAVYVAFAKIGNCMVCGFESDLRAGACFGCCDKVSGVKVPHGHRMWENANPKNFWYCGA